MFVIVLLFVVIVIFGIFALLVAFGDKQSPSKMKDYRNDLVYKCIKRLYFAEEMLNKYINGQDLDFFRSLDLEGYNPELRHPILDYSKNEKECFLLVCGKPLKLPTDFSEHSPKQVRDMIIKHRDELRIIAGMIENSMWLGDKNYLCFKPRKVSYFTGRLIC